MMKKKLIGKVEEKFSEFFEKWVGEQEDLVRQIVEKQQQMDEEHDRGLVSKATSHVKAYYSAKWAAASEDVLPFYSPTWVSPLEASFQWVTGWRPSTVFRAAAGVRGMSSAQMKRIEELRGKTKAEEEKVERDMERQQVAIADRRTTLGGMLAGLEKLMKAADCVRLRALKGVLDELNPRQSMELLVAVSMIQLRLRHFSSSSSSSSPTSLNATATCSTHDHTTTTISSSATAIN